VRELLKKMLFKYNGRDLHGINDTAEDAEVCVCVCVRALDAYMCT
jgi:hypothetical protein